MQGPRCVGTGGSPDTDRTGHCELMGWAAGAWVDFRVDGIDVSTYATDDALTAAFAGYVDALLVTIEAAGEPAARWTASASTPPIASCDDLGTADEVGEVSGLGEIWFGSFWDGPRVGQYVYAADTTGALRCSLGFLDRDAGFGHVSVLPGGEWGFLDAREDWLADGGSEVVVVGVEPGGAVLRCDDGEECILDLHRQHDWIRVAFPPVPPASVDYMPALDYAEARASAVPLAEALLANLDG
ncbi:hypothetical protein GCM10025877_06120 [Agromyces mangrovi Wang et al. 2018]|nr:hypothetical protein GCM10025877_06120 [Agromyces mangrovi]